MVIWTHVRGRLQFALTRNSKPDAITRSSMSGWATASCRVSRVWLTHALAILPLTPFYGVLHREGVCVASMRKEKQAVLSEYDRWA